MVTAEELSRVFGVELREDPLTRGLALTVQGKTIVISPTTGLASIGGRVVTLSTPPVRGERGWSLPMDVVDRALSLVYQPRLDVRPVTHLIVVGDVRDRWAADTVELVTAAGGTAIAAHCDVTSEAEVEALVATSVERFGRLDVMSNNAGVSTPSPGLKFVDHTEDDWQRLLGINLMGMVYGCKHAVLQFRLQGGGGVIVNTCSVAGMVGFGGVPYGPHSKFTQSAPAL